MDARPQDAISETGQDVLIARIGQLTRMLRDSMRELGLDRTIQNAAQAIPDARDRLRYVAQMTEQAANQALAASEKALPIQDALARDAKALSAELASRPSGQGADDALNAQIASFLADVPVQAGQTNALLMDIIMTQGFQDLTGQVITKMMDIVGTIERELVMVLLEAVPPERREEAESLLNGPQVIKDKADVVASQDQVDDLLASLGF